MSAATCPDGVAWCTDPEPWAIGEGHCHEHIIGELDTAVCIGHSGDIEILPPDMPDTITPQFARQLAAELIEAADFIEGLTV